MNESPAYTPPAIWTWKPGSGGRFANINRPIAGAVVSMGQARNGLPADPNAFKATTSADGFTPPLRIPDAEPLCIEVSAKGYVTRLDGPAWRVLDDGGVRRIVLERD